MVLVVDDNKLNIKVDSKVLSEFEFSIDSCDTGFSTIEKITEEDPHIHRVIPITDEDIEMLNRKLAEDLDKQREQEERENNN